MEGRQEVSSVRTDVVEESGRWVVYLDVVLASGGVRRRLGDYHDQRRASQAARLIEGNLRRHVPKAQPEPTQ